MRRLLCLLAVVFAGCLTDTVVVGDRCAVTLDTVSPDPAARGDTLTLTGGPFTTAYDTSVYVGSSRALVLDLARTSCGDCDRCREDNGCTECDDCDACDSLCSACEESVLVEVPDVASGATTVLVFNGYGATSPVSLTIAGPVADTGTRDTGAQDSGHVDTGGTGAEGPGR